MKWFSMQRPKTQSSNIEEPLSCTKVCGKGFFFFLMNHINSCFTTPTLSIMNKVTYLEGKREAEEAAYQEELQKEHEEIIRVNKEFEKRMIIEQAEEDAEEYWDDQY